MTRKRTRNNSRSTTAVVITILILSTVTTFGQVTAPPLFLPSVPYNTGGNTCYGLTWPLRTVAVADFNGDGIPDVAMTNCGNGTVAVFMGNGDGTLQSPVIYSAGGSLAGAIVSADVNGDGHPDLVVALGSAAAAAGLGLSVLLGNGDGTFQPPVLWTSNVVINDLAVADVNHDGKPDLIVTYGGIPETGGGSLAVLLGNGDGTFQPAVIYDAGPCPDYVAVADFNGDGNPDLVATESCFTDAIVVLLGDSSGTFGAPVTYNVPLTSNSGIAMLTGVATGDFNGDGKPDIAVGNWANDGDTMVNVLLGNGDGTFQSPRAFDSGIFGGLGGIAIADLNDDGKNDVMVLGSENWDGLSLLLGNGDGTFQPPTTYVACGSIPQAVVPVDLNGDGKLDFVVGNACPDDYTRCYNEIACVFFA